MSEHERLAGELESFTRIDMTTEGCTPRTAKCLDWLWCNRKDIARALRKLAAAEGECEKAIDLLMKFIETTSGNHTQHWDRTMRGGAGCEQCHAEQACRNAARQFIDAARAAHDAAKEGK